VHLVLDRGAARNRTVMVSIKHLGEKIRNKSMDLLEDQIMQIARKDIHFISSRFALLKHQISGGPI
jgi:tyrosine-protein phosphatase YwqE